VYTILTQKKKYSSIFKSDFGIIDCQKAQTKGTEQPLNLINVPYNKISIVIDTFFG
jgi:hypothetical protein